MVLDNGVLGYVPMDGTDEETKQPYLRSRRQCYEGNRSSGRTWTRSPVLNRYDYRIHDNVSNTMYMPHMNLTMPDGYHQRGPQPRNRPCKYGTLPIPVSPTLKMGRKFSHDTPRSPTDNAKRRQHDTNKQTGKKKKREKRINDQAET